VEFNLI